jgi:hypothetical protein
MLPAGHGSSCASSPSEAPPLEPNRDVDNAVRDRIVPTPGSYRRAFTEAELRAAGASVDEAQVDAGVLTLTFWGPPFKRRFSLEWPGSDRRPCRGIVHYPNLVAELRWFPTTPCTGYAAFTWRPDGGDMQLTGIGRGTDSRWARLLRSGTWKRVDCGASFAWGGIVPGRRRPCPDNVVADVLSKTGRLGAGLSPDGKRVAVETKLPDADGIVIGKRDGTDFRWLVRNRHDAPWIVENGWPVFSPDGDWVAFIRFRQRQGKPGATGGTAIFVIRTDGTGLERLTAWTTWAALPASIFWPPHGGSGPYVIERDVTASCCRSLTWSQPARDAAG